MDQDLITQEVDSEWADLYLSPISTIIATSCSSALSRRIKLR